MRRMRSRLQRVNDEMWHTTQQLNRLIRNRVAICHKRELPESEPVNGKKPVHRGDGRERDAVDDERTVKHVEVDVWVVHNVVKTRSENAESPSTEVNSDWAVFREHEQVVEAKDVIGVVVREDYIIDVGQLGAQRLGAEVGSAIDENVVRIWEADENRSASATILWII